MDKIYGEKATLTTIRMRYKDGEEDTIGFQSYALADEYFRRRQGQIHAGTAGDLVSITLHDGRKAEAKA